MSRILIHLLSSIYKYSSLVFGYSLLLSSPLVAQTNEVFSFNVKNFMVICDPDYSPSKSGQITNEDLLFFVCQSYLAGSLDGVVTVLTLGNAVGEKGVICLPSEGVNPKGLTRMLRNFIESKKNELDPDSPIRGLIFATLANYFPCRHT
jgi:hypothetical protein